jgi:hypothetical protein
MSMRAKAGGAQPAVATADGEDGDDSIVVVAPRKKSDAPVVDDADPFASKPRVVTAAAPTDALSPGLDADPFASKPRVVTAAAPTDSSALDLDIDPFASKPRVAASVAPSTSNGGDIVDDSASAAPPAAAKKPAAAAPPADPELAAKLERMKAEKAAQTKA